MEAETVEIIVGVTLGSAIYVTVLLTAGWLQREWMKRKSRGKD